MDYCDQFDASRQHAGTSQVDGLAPHQVRGQDESEPGQKKSSLYLQSSFPQPTKDALKNDQRLARRKIESEHRVINSYRHADSHVRPWTGSRAEDTLNDQVVKSGFADRFLPLLQAESHTARPNVWPAIKSKSGLPVISALFAQIIERRHSRGRCTAPYAYKPPPRVTLTDSKREAWLRDLATQSVPLRRLSRTIPHGIRGKTLIEQVAAKSIPIPRAVWLVKCVGANELRTFRRKGISEAAVLTFGAKWLIEWTTFVQDAVDHAFESNHGQARYIARLATALYDESLLHTDHHMEWLLTRLGPVASDSLPFWLVLVHVHWNHLTCNRSWGHRLAEIIVTHLQSLSSQDLQCTTLLEHLKKITSSMATTRVGCFIGTNPWNLRLPDLQTLTEHEQHALCRIESRNRRLHSFPPSPDAKLADSLLQLYLVLDGATAPYRLSEILSACDRVGVSSSAFTFAVLEWSCTSRRQGRARVYLAAALLRHWWHQESYGYVVGFLSSTQNKRNLDRECISSLLGELVSSGHFSFTRYLQELIIRGRPAFSGHGSIYDGLLTELPHNVLSSHAKNLLRILLCRSDIKSTDAVERLQCVISQMKRDLTMLYKADSPNSVQISPMAAVQGNLSGTSKRTLAEWLLRMITNSESDISKTTFDYARAVLTQLCDYHSLSLLVQHASATRNPGVLTSVALTIHTCIDEFAAIGCLESHVETLCQRRQDVPLQDPANRAWLAVLVDLTSRLQYPNVVIDALRSDLEACDHYATMTGCSPASDSAMTVSLSVTATPSEIDAILESGTTMDAVLFERTAAIIFDRTTKEDPSNSQALHNACRWLPRLRSFDRHGFERYVTQYMMDAISRISFGPLKQVLVPLVEADCVDLFTVNQICREHLAVDSSQRYPILKGCLALVLPDKFVGNNFSCSVTYKFRAAQNQLFHDHRTDILRMACDCVVEAIKHFDRVAFPGLNEILQYYVVKDLESFIDAVKVTLSTLDAHLSSRLLAALGIELDTVVGLNEAHMRKIFLSVDALSFPFAFWTINADKILESKAASTEGFGSDDLSGHLVEALKACIGVGNIFWRQLLDKSSQHLRRALFQWSFDLLLSACSSLGSQDDTLSPDASTTERYLEVFSETLSSAEAPAEYAQKIIDSLKSVFEYALESPLDRSTPTSIDRWCVCLETLTRMVTYLHSVRCERVINADQCRPLVSMWCKGLGMTLLREKTCIRECFYEAACVLASDLPKDSLSSIALQLRSSGYAIDSSTAFVLGCHVLSEKASLVLATKVAAMSKKAASSRPLLDSVMSTTKMTAIEPSPTSPVGLPSPSDAETPLGGKNNRSTQKSGTNLKYTKVKLRPWEVLADSTPKVGANDSSISMTLFAARKVP